MNYTVGNAKDDLASMLHGTTVSQINNINGAFRRAANVVLSRIDPAETMRVAELTVYDGINEYSPPTDLKDRKVSDITPQVNRTSGDSPRNFSGNDFETRNENNSFRVYRRDGETVLKYNKRLTPARKILAHFDGNEGWTADGTGLTDLQTDTLLYAEAGSSQRFNKASGQTSGTLTTTTISAIDLTSYQDTAAFIRVYLPTLAAATGLTSLTLRWGSSASDYWEATATAPHNRSGFNKGWNLVRFDWPTSDTGTPVVTAVDYARLALTTSSAAINAIRVDELFFSVGKIVDFEYYSNCLFRDEDGNWSEEVDDDSGDDTIINLGPTSYEIFLNELGLICCQGLQGEAAASDRTAFKEALFGAANQPGLYDEYLEGNPTEAIAPRTTWY